TAVSGAGLVFLEQLLEAGEGGLAAHVADHPAGPFQPFPERLGAAGLFEPERQVLAHRAEHLVDRVGGAAAALAQVADRAGGAGPARAPEGATSPLAWRPSSRAGTSGRPDSRASSSAERCPSTRISSRRWRMSRPALRSPISCWPAGVFAYTVFPFMFPPNARYRSQQT